MFGCLLIFHQITQNKYQIIDGIWMWMLFVQGLNLENIRKYIFIRYLYGLFVDGDNTWICWNVSLLMRFIRFSVFDYFSSLIKTTRIIDFKYWKFSSLGRH